MNENQRWRSEQFKRAANNTRLGRMIRPVVFKAPVDTLLTTFNYTAPGEASVIAWPPLTTPVGPLTIPTTGLSLPASIPDRMWFKFPAPISSWTIAQTVANGAYKDKTNVYQYVIMGEITDGYMNYPPKTQENNFYLTGYFVSQPWDPTTLVQSNAPGTDYWFGNSGFAADYNPVDFATSGSTTELVPPTVGGSPITVDFAGQHQITFKAAFDAILTINSVVSVTNIGLYWKIELSTPVGDGAFDGGQAVINSDGTNNFHISSNDANYIYASVTETPPAPGDLLIIYPTLYGFFLFMTASFLSGGENSYVTGFQNWKIRRYGIL